MYIRLFVETEDFKYCKEVLNNVLSTIKNKIEKIDIVKLEKYWKMEELTVLEAEISLLTELTDHEKGLITYTVADRVEFFGDPTDEVLVSRTMEDCKIYIENLYMIIIYF